MKTEKTTKAVTLPKGFRDLVTKGLNGAAAEEGSIRAIYERFIQPLTGPDNRVTDAGQGMYRALLKATRVWSTDWMLKHPRTVDGVTYQPDTLRAIWSKGDAATGTEADVVKAIKAGANTKAWRFCATHLAKAEKGTAGAVAVGQARSKARKGKTKGSAAPVTKAADAATVAASVPALTDALMTALRNLKPQSRIVAATAVLNLMQTAIREARTEVDKMPRKAAKAAKAAKADTVAAPAPVAVQ